MTIAAGFVCRDGIVICADTQLSLNSLKATRTKLFMSSRHEKVCRVAIATAGDYDLCKAAIQFTEPMLGAKTPPTMQNIQTAFEDAIGDIYTNHIYPNRLDQKHVQLMIGAWTRGDGLRLFKTYDTTLIRVDKFEAVGTGSEIAEHILNKLYDAKMSVGHGVALAIYLLSEVKQLDKFCGGETHILVVHSDGRLSSVVPEQIAEYEMVNKALDTVWKSAFWVCFDLDRSEAQFGKDVTQITDVMRQMRCPMVKSESLRRAGARKGAGPIQLPSVSPRRATPRSLRSPKRDR